MPAVADRADAAKNAARAPAKPSSMTLDEAVRILNVPKEPTAAEVQAVRATRHGTADAAEVRGAVPRQRPAHRRVVLPAVKDCACARAHRAAPRGAARGRRFRDPRTQHTAVDAQIEFLFGRAHKQT